MDDGFDRFIGATPREDNWTIADCQWTRYQYLCPQETGAGFACGTVIPSAVNFKCQTGYTPTADGHCRLDPEVEEPCGCEADDGRVNHEVGNPIVLSSGAKVLRATDYESADGKFRIERSYRSYQSGRPVDGVGLPRSQPRGLRGGWNFNFAYEIQLGAFVGTTDAPGAKIAVLGPDGSTWAFVLTSTGQWVPDPALGTAHAPRNLKVELLDSLPYNLQNFRSSYSHWRLTDGADNVWLLETRQSPNSSYYSTAWPTQKTHRDGYKWTYLYNSDGSLATITDGLGRTATLTWHQFYVTAISPPPSGSLAFPLAVKSIALPDGTSLNYSYDPPPTLTAPTATMPRRLVKVERLSAASAVLDSTSYLYEDTRFGTHVTGVIDNRGIRTRTYAYDARGRATATQGPDGINAYSVQYGQNRTARTRRVTGPLAKSATYTFGQFSAGPADYRLTQIAGEASPKTAASTASLTYGTDTFIAGATDDENRLTTTTRDFRGRPLTIVEGSGTASQRTATITWHPTFNVPLGVVRDGLTESRAYNTSGQLTSVTLTDTASQTVPYSTNGQSRTSTYTWNTKGQLLTLNGPLPPDAQNNDDVTTFAYTAQGNLQTVTNAFGHVTSFAGHDANGRPATVTDPNGVVTALTYDGMGRVATMAARHPSVPAQDAVTSFGYDAVGQLISLTLPSTETLLMDYDAAGRVTAMRAAGGERRDFAYDAMGNVLSETDKRADASLSRQITRTFDELGRIVAQSTGTGHTARWSYDKVGNPVAATSPNGNATTAAFDALDRVVNTVAPDSGTTALAYDQKDGLTAFTDPKTVTTQFVRNGFGEVIQEVSPDRGTSTYWYDAAGQLTQSSDGRGQIIAYTHDLLGRVTSKTPQARPASETVVYTWDSGGLSGTYAVGRLGKVEDGTGTTQFQYDHRGNPLAKQQTIGTSGAAQLTYTYDLADRITQITYPSGRQVAYGYDAKGRVSSVQTRAAGVSMWTTVSSAYAYEPFGAVKAMALGNGLAVTILRQAQDDRIASRRLYRTADGTSLSWLAYGYDADDNIAGITNQLAATGSTLYGYDRTGRLSLTVVDAASLGDETYAYTAGTNRLAAVTAATGTRSVTYDARGNTAAETRPGGVTASTGYDGYARLTSYIRSDAGTLSFAYNGLDDRVAMTLPASGTRRFVYDAGGRVMGEYGTSASDVKAEFIWAAPEVGAGSIWGGGDGLGGYMPLAVATPDSTCTIQLNWVHGNHLGVPLLTTDATGALATTPNDYLAPGFPGQSRVLPDLYYNRYRDYDPATGRYVQADPIGLGGGSNPYLYAWGNPISLTDPTGEFVPIIIGALIGFDLALGYQVWWEGKRGNCIDWREVGIETAFGAFGGELVSPALKLTRGSMKFVNVSKRIRRAEGLVGKPIDLHHGILPRRLEGLGPWARPIVNHPANLRPVARDLHRLMHSRRNPFYRWFGLPVWAKTGGISTGAGIGAEAADGD